MENSKVLYTEKENTNKTIERMIAVAISFSPFNKLRVAGIGITEVILLLLAFYSVFILRMARVTKKDNQVSKMYFNIIFFSLVGYLYNMLFLGNIGDHDTAAFNFVSYIICMISCFSVEILIRHRIVNAETILDNSFRLLSIMALALYVISRVTPSLFGIRLLYYSYFSPLSNNIHQLAMVISMFPMLGIYLCKKKKTYWEKSCYLILAIANVIVGTNTGSTKFILGIIVGCISVAIISIINSSVRYKTIIALCIAFASILIFIINWNYIVILFRDNDLHGGRETLYSGGVKLIIKSPIFGYGPLNVVTNAYGRYMDAHETIITTYLTGGIVAAISLILIVYKKVIILINNKWLFGSICGFLIYLTGGDILRKECLWIMLILSAECCRNDASTIKLDHKIA